MSVATASIRNSHVPSGPQGKQSLSSPGIDYVASKKRKEDSSSYQSLAESKSAETSNDIEAPTTIPSSQHHDKKDGCSSLSNGNSPSENLMHSTNHSSAPSMNTGSFNSINNMTNGSHYPSNCLNNGGTNLSDNTQAGHDSVDSAGPLPNEIFELLNEFWRPNDLVGSSTSSDSSGHIMSGAKFSRRSPDGSLDETVEEEKGRE